MLPVDEPVLLVEPVPVLAVLALAGPGMRVTEKMIAMISATAVNVANTISAGDPRQNLLLVGGCAGADAKYVVDDGVDVGAAALAAAGAVSGADASGAATTGSVAGVAGSSTTDSRVAGVGGF